METNAESHSQSSEEQGGTIMENNLERRRRRRGRRRCGLTARKMQTDVRNLSTCTPSNSFLLLHARMADKSSTLGLFYILPGDQEDEIIYR
jgi:hypothetical protein